MENGFGVENSSLNVSDAQLDMPLISAADDTQVNFTEINAYALQLKQSKGTNIHELLAVNLTTNNSDFINLETKEVLAINLRAETLESVTASVSDTLTSQNVTVSSATTNKLQVGTHTVISDSQTSIGSATSRVAVWDESIDRERVLDISGSLSCSDKLSIMTGGTLTFDSDSVWLPSVNASLISVSGNSTISGDLAIESRI